MAKETFDQILSTFKFLDQNRVTTCTDTKTYKSLEEALKQSEDVCYLDLSNTNLASLPVDVLKLANLQSLYLNNNQLSSLPKSITQLKHLTTIDLTRNPISDSELKKLRTLMPNASIAHIKPMN
ncbi:leucine-rich repeat domain-containing protein [Patescibacteria group bacterium]|nr:leucine-rich repeat domain-containing protein [Patescibacteria group bacterium]